MKDNVFIRAIRENFDDKVSSEIKEIVNETRSIYKGTAAITLPTKNIRGTIADSASTMVQEFISKPTNNILKANGATVFENLKNNLDFPIITDENVCFKANGFGEKIKSELLNVTIKPKRVVARASYSTILLKFANADVQQAVVNDLLDAIEQAFEKAILSNAAGSEDLPKGIFNGQETTTLGSYDDIIEMEYKATTKDMKNLTYLASPKAAKALKKMKNGTTPIYNNGIIDGIRVIETNNVQDGFLCLLDLSNVIITEWGALDVETDKVTKMVEGNVVLTINGYINGALKHPNQIVVSTVE
ncbi:phage major capsid protein [[Hallella] seregens]|uniref:Phage major capsid protein n=1 Tax=Hallella seregens ATCC 51272 TaxID=1336250 RepID=A0ABV5ZNA7_9BACT|nr:phage major capsid protein [Hallella seregens]